MSTNFEMLKEYLNNDKKLEAAMLLLGLCPTLKNCSYSCDSCTLKIFEWGTTIVSEPCNGQNCNELTKLITELKAIIENQKEIISKQ